ncbi:hypothetical protein Dsin_021040 [Dipteronia sinensis]|uniref:RNase H type-1 domain-containing protein n=1 Tax=Dipteronia sinensis TaxID=43782 RepID=A0AAE0AB55_9ROSI|nr:hypothetical protein Dsin_021040 [Dipteronia sinensis]
MVQRCMNNWLGANKKDSDACKYLEENLDTVDSKARIDGWSKSLRKERLSILTKLWMELRREEQLWRQKSKFVPRRFYSGKNPQRMFACFWNDVWNGDVTLNMEYPRIFALSMKKCEPIKDFGRWQGEVLCSFAAPIGNLDTITVEIWAIHKAYSLCLSKASISGRSIQIVSDSLKAISWINNDDLGNLIHVNIIYDIRAMIFSLRNSSVIHTLRTANSYADSLAKRGMDLDGEIVDWVVTTD